MPSEFEDVISSAHPEFKPEAGRYHLYVSVSCPYAVTCYCAMLIKGLDHAIGTSFAHWYIDVEERWRFTGEDGSTLDHTGQPTSSRELYLKHYPNYTGRFSVPVLFDKKTNKIVSNDTNKILESLSTAFDDFAKSEEQKKLKLLGANDDIKLDRDAFESWFNKECYYGFSRMMYQKDVTQEWYNLEVERMTEILNKIEARLKNSRFVCGNSPQELTVSDIKLFIRMMFVLLLNTTLIRVDSFNIRIDYPVIYDHCRDIYNLFSVGEKGFHQKYILKTQFLDYRKKHLNFNQIVPHGPRLDMTLPEERIDKFSF